MNQLSSTAKAESKKTEHLSSLPCNPISIVVPDKTNIPKSSSLSPSETKLLAKWEEVVDRNLKAFNEVCTALLEIRDQRLYRVQYPTFEEYCQARWGFTARHANRLMLAGEVVENLKSDQLVSNIPLAIPRNEAQARPLQHLSPDKQVEAARLAAEKADKPTAKQFAEAVEAVATPKTATKAPAQVQAAKSGHVKSNDNGGLEKLLELIDAAQTQARTIETCAEIAKSLSELAKLITRKLNGGAA